MYHRGIHKTVMVIQTFFQSHNPVGIQDGRYNDIQILRHRQFGITIFHILRNQFSGNQLHTTGKMNVPVFPSQKSQKKLLFNGFTIVNSGFYSLKHRNGYLFFFNDVVAANHFLFGAGKLTNQLLHHVWFNPVITVHKGKVLSPGHLYPCQPGRHKTAIFLMEYPNPTVQSGIFIAKPPAVVPGAVVHQQNIQIGIGLVKNTVHTVFQIFFYIINRNNYTDQRFTKHLQPPFPPAYPSDTFQRRRKYNCVQDNRTQNGLQKRNIP